jgi:AraC-like DNA-binding protein
MQFSALTVIYRSWSFAQLEPLAKAANFGALLQQVETMPAAALDGGGESCAMDQALLAADLMLALGREEEAEERFRLAVRIASGLGKTAVRFASGRVTACMRLHQHQFPMAAACFEHVLEDESTTPAQRIEVLCGLAYSAYALGQYVRSLNSLASARQLLEAAGASAGPGLQALVAVAEMHVQASIAIRQQQGLEDHVHWQSAGAGGERGVQTVLALAERAQALCGGDQLVERHVQHVRLLLQMDHVERLPESEAIHQYLMWLRQSSMQAQELQARLDAALTAIAHRRVVLARRLLMPLLGADSQALARHDAGLDLSYCMAKLYMLSGLMDQALEHYQRYTRAAIKFARSSSRSQSQSRYHEAPDAGAAQPDALEVRLPARYRKAYRYIMVHLDRFELSVREIADAMGVTERALQMAFKGSVGMTPGEVIQRARVERIRADLLQANAADASITETAARWGIRNRSTLVSAYRRHFHETPKQTLARSSEALPMSPN